MDLQTRGWVSPKAEGEPFVHRSGQQLLISLGLEKKLLPSTVINQFTKARAAEIEEREGYKPGRKQMKEIKEAVTDELLPRAFAIRSRINAWIDLEGQWIGLLGSTRVVIEDWFLPVGSKDVGIILNLVP